MKRKVGEITEAQIRSFLNEYKIVHGVIDENLQILVKKYPYTRDIKIARGTPPTKGKDAEIKFVKEVKTDLTPEMSQYGRVDFKKLNLISSICAGETIQIRKPPTKGQPGRDIFGIEIPGIDGKDIPLKTMDQLK